MGRGRAAASRGEVRSLHRSRTSGDRDQDRRRRIELLWNAPDALRATFRVLANTRDPSDPFRVRMGLRLDLSAHHGSGAPLGDPEGQERTGRGRVRQEGRGSAETGAAGMIEIFREIFGAFWAFGRSRIFKYF